ncbi:MAG: glycosyl transferase [Bacteroidales bacterium]|nr:MAG: glycosyl transferase [Bacteroidales bacterium]
MYNFCTLFDSYYLSRGLVMYESLKENLNQFHLYIFAFDDLCYQLLEKLKPEKTTIISLEEFEDEELLNVKKDRTKAEYCWTCTPSVIDYVIKTYNLPDCTYLDADLYFYNSPDILLQEMNKNTVLVTEHRYSRLARLYEQKRAGRFCVQFITFTGHQSSTRILEKWKGQCIDWCYNRYEDGKFGDQKYLDEWPELYENVHILQHLGGGVAPWNVSKYHIEKRGDSYTGIHKKDGQKFSMIFFHFQYVKFMDNGLVDIGWHILSKQIIKDLYLPYLKRLFEVEKKLCEADSRYRTYYAKFKSEGVKDTLKNLFKKITKYNLIKTDNFWHGVYS